MGLEPSHKPEIRNIKHKRLIESREEFNRSKNDILKRFRSWEISYKEAKRLLEKEKKAILHKKKTKIISEYESQLRKKIENKFEAYFKVYDSYSIEKQRYIYSRLESKVDNILKNKLPPEKKMLYRIILDLVKEKQNTIK